MAARIKEEISQVVRRHLDNGQFLVDVVIKGARPNQKVIVLIDGDNGVSIKDCAAISRKISIEMEERLEELLQSSYTLEVSSPGLDHPITLVRQYKKNVGREVKVISGSQNEGKEYIGTLIKVNDQELELQLDDKAQSRVMISLMDIDKTFVLASFKSN